MVQFSVDFTPRKSEKEGEERGGGGEDQGLDLTWLLWMAREDH